MAADLAEWIAPEIAQEGDVRPASGWRYGAYILVGIAAAIVLAFIVFDASSMALTDRPSVQRSATW